MGRARCARRAPPRLALSHRRRPPVARLRRCCGAATWPRRRSELAQARRGVRSLGLRRATPQIYSRGLPGRSASSARGDLAARAAALERRLRHRRRRRRRAPTGAAPTLELLVAEGRDAEALARRATPTRAARAGSSNPALHAAGARCAARALARAGPRDEALAAGPTRSSSSRAGFGAPRGSRRALRVLGTLRAATRACRTWRRRSPSSTARPPGSSTRAALAALGAALRRARRPAEAREPLRARAGARRRAAAPARWPSTCAPSCYATGARPRTTALRGVESLTRQRAARGRPGRRGRTNRDIAQALFVTPKTVEVHLSNAYRKLGVRSRRELAGALGA